MVCAKIISGGCTLRVIPAHFASFCLLAVVVVVTPGQDTALTIRNTLAGGRRAGVLSAAGVVTGQAAWAVATGAGLSSLLLASAAAFAVLKLAGACYLVYLGVQSIWHALRRAPAAAERPAPRLRPSAAYRQGLVSNLGNPKIALFFTSLLPQFAGAHASFGELVAMGAVVWALTLVWLSAYAVVVHRAGDVLRRPRVRRRIELVTGSTLAALGVRIALERH